MPDVGSHAPDFTLMNQERQPAALSRLVENGPVVLAFFPAAFSSVCTTELCTLRDGLGQLCDVRATVVGISVDTFFTLAAFGKAEGLPFPLLSDFNKDVIRAYGVYNEDMIGLKGIAKRAVFLVDAQRIVRYREVLEDARLQPDYQALRAAVAALT